MDLVATMQRAAGLLQAGDLAGGSSLCREVLRVAPRHPGALHLLALAARDSGDAAAAESWFRESLAGAPRQPGLLVDFGRLLRDQGRIPEAERLLRTATDVAPDFVPAWHHLGRLLWSERRLDEARRCAHQVVARSPGYVAGWELLAAIEQRANASERAIAACREGLRHTPKAARLHYALAQILRQECLFDEAVRAYESALQCGYDAPELYRNCAEAQFESGDVAAALGVFDAAIERYPEHALLHRLRARIHWESGVGGDPVEAMYGAARAHPYQAALWQALVDFLNRLDRKDEGRAVLHEARMRGCPETPEIALLEALACRNVGDIVGATGHFTRLLDAYPGHSGIKLAFAEHLISAGDPAYAEALCGQVLTVNPHAQLAWALRGTAWQLLRDERESWLLDYERMVRPVAVPPPSGYSSSEAFFRDVEKALLSRHQMQAHPIEQTVRGGTQTNGYLFRLKDPLLRVLETQIRIAVRAALAAFPQDPGHPYWGQRNAGAVGDGFRFAGAWSVRLRSQGYHTNHVHPEGWISSALYVALPDEVRGARDSAGCIQFGVPPVEMGLELAPRRIVRPSVGELVLFPSYMWHGTLPFTSEQSRITVAFDLIPEVESAGERT